jgi:cytochrome c nitrite reductase small subunit
MSRKRTVVIAVLLGVVAIGGVGAVGFWQYHEQPQFCATCHIMDPYLESWQSSEYGAAGHAEQGVACLDCHEPTFQQQMDELVMYVQGDFTVPLEEREYADDFCFDCHEANEHTGYEEVTQRTAGLEINPHDSHLGEMECATCHKMHKPSEDYCAQCHEPVATGGGWTTEVTTTAEVDLWAPDMDCAVCHSMDPYSESLQDSNLLAYAHAEEGLACLDCHDVEEVELVHEEAVPGARISGKKVEMEACFECHVANEHTSYEQVIGRTQDYTVDDEKINPHDPHAGLEKQDQFQCSLCHRMHEESLLINGCYGCHHEGTFESCSECH